MIRVASPYLVRSRRDKVIIHGLILVLAFLRSSYNFAIGSLFFVSAIDIGIRRVLLHSPASIEVSGGLLVASSLAFFFFVANEDLLALVDMVVHLSLYLAHGDEWTFVWALGVQGVVGHMLVA